MLQNMKIQQLSIERTAHKNGHWPGVGWLGGFVSGKWMGSKPPRFLVGTFGASVFVQKFRWKNIRHQVNYI